MAEVYEAYSLGLKIAGTAIPDPSSYAWKESDLDLSGERDTTGLLHREKVGTKRHAELSYDALSWETIGMIMSLTRPLETFEATLPEPGTGTPYTGTFYSGDRESKAILLAGAKSEWFGSLSFNLIEV